MCVACSEFCAAAIVLWPVPQNVLVGRWFQSDGGKSGRAWEALVSFSMPRKSGQEDFGLMEERSDQQIMLLVIIASN